MIMSIYSCVLLCLLKWNHSHCPQHIGDGFDNFLSCLNLSSQQVQLDSVLDDSFEEICYGLSALCRYESRTTPYRLYKGLQF